MSTDTQVQTLRLVLGDQLNPVHTWFQAVDPAVVYVLMEVRSETDYVVHHAQKVIAIFAAMRDFQRMLEAAGHRVHYLRINAPENQQHITKNLEYLAEHYGARAVQCQSPDEWRLDALLSTWRDTSSLSVECVDSEHFLTDRFEAQRLFEGKRSWLMASFYRAMRLKHGVLLDAGRQPVGGKWSFDADNRHAWRGPTTKQADPLPPPDRRPAHDHASVWADIQTAGVVTMGEPQAATFRWPLNRAEALVQLEAFIAEGLPYFGHYQDAMHTAHWRLFHALLSFALNVKMLSPKDVVQRAEQAYEAGLAPIEAAEGFIRQVLGWREYIRGVYWAQMPGYDDSNALDQQLALPAWFWTGETRMRCMQHAIGQSLTHAYAHHIQRLMVIGNFALIAGLSPQAVHRWYLGIYIDAFEWVELPNTIGMSQYADGGLLATKPYASSAAYIHRMSDYCKGCHYKKDDKLGDDACPLNALYWDFFEQKKPLLGRNPRLGLVYKNLERMPETDRAAIARKAAQTRDELDRL